MKLLFRYVFLHHTRLLLLTLSVGIGLYLLTEIVERVDTFVEADSSFSLVAQYYIARLPSIIAQILPAVFLLASVVTLCIMHRSREMVALQAGGVSPNAVARVLVICGLIWGAGQLAFSQYLGVEGDMQADRIWREEVRKQVAEAQILDNIWFTEGSWIVSAQTLSKDGTGTHLSAYQLSTEDTGLRFASIVRAESFQARPGEWLVTDAVRTVPDSFLREKLPTFTLPLKQDPSVFFVSEQSNPQQLSIWRLGEAIGKLRTSGSNVEGLVTAWHAKLAYAASLVVMALLASAIVSWKDNIYLAVAFAMVITFVSYAVTLFGESMGQQGVLPPILAAWGPNIILLSLALLRLRYVSLKR